jgi:hypothetical protein
VHDRAEQPRAAAVINESVRAILPNADSGGGHAGQASTGRLKRADTSSINANCAGLKSPPAATVISITVSVRASSSVTKTCVRSRCGLTGTKPRLVGSPIKSPYYSCRPPGALRHSGIRRCTRLARGGSALRDLRALLPLLSSRGRAAGVAVSLRRCVPLTRSCGAFAYLGSLFRGVPVVLALELIRHGSSPKVHDHNRPRNSIAEGGDLFAGLSQSLHGLPVLLVRNAAPRTESIKGQHFFRRGAH